MYVPVCIYENPGSTHFTFTDELHGRLSSLEGVNSVKISDVPDITHVIRALELK